MLLKVVLDTNCFISCIGKESPYRNIFNSFLNKQYIICLSTEILLEYEEKFTEFWGEQVTHNLLGLLLTAENSSLHSVFYNFRLVAGDADDNKFADVYLAASADVLVTNDRKLLALSKNAFPHIRTMNLQDFAHYLEESII
ncbi:MAG: putative toxin-antitoxin system toxin component, PIN family [Cyclobacteriaceae bacterium]